MKFYIWAAIYGLFDILKYLLCLIIVFSAPLKKRKIFIPIWITLSLLLCVAYYSWRGFDEYFFLMPNICSVFLIFGFENRYKLKGILYILLSWVIMDPLGGIVEHVLAMFSHQHDYLLAEASVNMLVVRIIVLLILTIYHVVVNVLIRKKVTYTFYPYQWGVIFVSFIGMLLIVPTMEDIVRGVYVESDTYLTMCISIMLMFFLFIIVMIWQSYVMRKNMIMRENELNYQYMIKSQSDYFDNLMKNDEEMRKLRHDMRAHITALRELAAANPNDNRMLEYLTEMEEKTNATRTKRYTSNKAVDAVINELTHQMDEIGIEFKFDGMLRIREDIKDFDLCTIFYNTLQNAIEGCEKVEGAKKLISVKVKNIGDKLGISVVNDTILKKLPDSGVLYTTKSDKVNHGLGTKNVKEVVNKYEGIYDNSIENGRFVVDIII